MWIFLPNSYPSIVQKSGDAEAGTLTVRGRIKGDIEAVRTDAVVSEGGGTDYRYRAKIPREAVAQALHDQVMCIGYSNFKGSVKDHQRHDAYMRVWAAMFGYQQHQK